MEIKYGSVCSGVESATLAWHDLGWIPVFYAEVEPFPSAVLMQRFGATKPLRPLDPDSADNEKDRKQRVTWQKQIAEFPSGGTVPNLGDFTKITKDDYEGKIDLLVGGTPCQSFSVVGNRKGLSGVSGLALEFIRLAYETGCRWVVWENVPGVFSTNRGRDFAAFLSGLTGQQIKTPDDGWRTAGLVRNGRNDRFGVAWRTLDAQYVRTHQFPYAVPQRRRRVFVVGYFGDWHPAAKVLLEPERLSWDTPPRIKTRQASAGDVGKSAENANIKLCYENHAQDSRVKEIQISPILSAKAGTGGNNLPLVVSCCLAEKIINRNIKNSGNGLGCSEELAYTTTTGGVHAIVQCDNLAVYCSEVRGNSITLDLNISPTLTATCNKLAPVVVKTWDKKDIMQNTTVTSNNNYILERGNLQCVIDSGVRRLTPLECERLMGFPDNHTRIKWRGKEEMECPDSPRYKACGNSMCVNVMQWIGERIDAVEKELKHGK